MLHLARELNAMPNRVVERGKQWLVIHSLLRLDRYCHVELNARMDWLWVPPRRDQLLVNVYGCDTQTAPPMFMVTLNPNFGGPLDMETTLRWWCKLVRGWDMHSGRRRIWSLSEIADYMPSIMDRYNEMIADPST
jgi:hypothetical protein